MKQEMMYVYTVWQEGSFSRAAEKLYLTQPALSIAIQKTEQALGMPLFDRSRRPLQLTDAGEIYIDTVKKMLLLEQEQQQRLLDLKEVVTGTIQLGGTHYLNAYILPDILAEFSRLYPGVNLEIMEAGSYALGEMLEDNKLDMTFSCHPHLIKEFDHYEMFHDRILLAVPASHPINEKMGEFALSAKDIMSLKHLSPNCPAVNLKDFAELEFILLRKGNNLYHRARDMFREAEMDPKIKMTLSQMVTAYHLADANMGATFIGDRLVKQTDDKLKYYRLQSSFVDRLFYILLPKRDYVSTAARTLIQFIQAHI